MVCSMTGYGRSSIGNENLTITTEMKSVNHRFFEINVRMPRQLMSIEDKIKKVVSSVIHRGRVELYITVDGGALADQVIEVDWKLLDQYVHAVKEMESRYGPRNGLQVSDLIKLDNIINIGEQTKGHEEIHSLLFASIQDATQKLKEMRIAEGGHLKKDLLKLLTEMESYVSGIEKQAPQVVIRYKSRLEKKIAELSDGMIDDSRIVAEAALFADRSDITEEIARIRSHLLQFRETLQMKGSIGRKLDFIVQELNREANTIGSKANDQEISKATVEMKSIIEKLKEQVQNIE